MQTAQTGFIAPDLKILAALLTSAFEGGSDYWAEVQKCNKPDSLDFMLDGPDGAPYPHVDYPLNEGGSVVVLDVTAGRTYELTIDSCLKGWNVMPEAATKSFAAVLTDAWDQNTADEFLQCCLFGQVMYA
jgi:hypothetical protein